MRILVQCPSCHYRNSINAESCSGKITYGAKKGQPCKVNNIRNRKDLIYWIEYRLLGKKIRKKVGNSKEEAEKRLEEVRKESHSLK